MEKSPEGFDGELYLCSHMSETKRYFLELSYKGTPFHGWQIQKNAFTVQECLESALSTYFRKPMYVTGSGRTDTGVHASMQVCHFDLTEGLPGENFLKKKKCAKILNWIHSRACHGNGIGFNPQFQEAG